MMPVKHLIAVFALASASLHAAPRPWKSADGQRSVIGEFVSRDASSVTIMRSDRKEAVITFDKLHADDLAWLNSNHPLPQSAAPNAAVFDQLLFGDTRNTVLEKLKNSKFVELTTDEIFLGRTGLNGVFRTRRKLGGLNATLFFDWTGDGALNEVTLQSEALPASSLDERMVPCWKEMIELLTTLHGKPINANNQLDLTPIEDGAMSATHLWRLDDTGSAMLGAAREGDEYQIVVRFTRQKIQPVVIPGAAPIPPSSMGLNP